MEQEQLPGENVPIAAPSTTIENKKRKKVAIIFSSIFLLVCFGFALFVIFFYHQKQEIKEAEKPVISSGAPSYVTSIYYALPKEQLLQRQKEIEKELGKSWQVTLDEYGFAKQLISSDSALYGGDYTDIINSSSGNIFTKKEIEYWNNFIKEHASIFGIDSKNVEQFTYAKSIINSYDFLQIQQHVNTTLLFTSSGLDSAIHISRKFAVSPKSIISAAVIVSGHFWPNFSVPKNARVSKEDIEEVIVGQQIKIPQKSIPCNPLPNHPCPAPTDNQVMHYITKAEVQIDLVPYLYKKGNMMQGRLAYKVTLKNNQTFLKLFDAITKDKLD